MNRIDTPGNVSGVFTEANPLEGLIPTQIGPQWLNDIQEEVVGWILISGQNLSKGTQTQLLLALLIISQAQLAAQTGRELEVSAPMDLVAGDMVAIEDLFGTAGAAVVSGHPLTTTRMGTYTLAKNAGETWLAGETLYWDIALRAATNVSGTGGLKRIGFSPGPAESAATTAAVLLDGNSAPESASPGLGSNLVRTLTPPSGYTYADAIGVLNDQTHIAVLWDGSATSNILALYDPATSGTPVWTQVLDGDASQSDRIWVARDTADFLLLHENSLLSPDRDQWSKYNADGQLWQTERYITGGNYRWGAGLSADGVRVTLVGTDTLDNQGTEIIILDGADATPTNKIKFDSITGSVEHAMSASGAVLVGNDYMDYAAHAISADGELTTGVGGAGLDQAQEPGPGVAVADDGLSFILGCPESANGPETVFVKRIGGTWTEFRFPCASGKVPMACAISGDGSKALWVEAQDSSLNAEPVVFVVDCSTGLIATDGKGTEISYPLVSSGSTASGQIRDVELTQDGSQFLVIARRNSDEATAWIGQTGTHNLADLFTAPAANYSTRCGGMALDGGLVAIGADAGTTRIVNVYDIS